jgi:plastocyanin
MSRRKYARGGMAVAALTVAAAVAVPAFAAAPANVTQKTVGKPKFVSNRSITDNLHFKLDRISIKKGGTLTIKDTSGQDHTLSLVKRSQVPRNIKGVDGCFGKGPCDEIAVAHGAVDPNTGQEQPPTKPLVNVGKAGFNQPGDSVVIPAGKQAKVKVTGSGPLYYICAIHPWMNGAINGKPVR